MSEVLSELEKNLQDCVSIWGRSGRSCLIASVPTNRIWRVVDLEMEHFKPWQGRKFTHRPLHILLAKALVQLGRSM